MEMTRKITVSKHSNSRPNALAYKLTLSVDMIKELGIDQVNREVKIVLEDGKLIIEKI